MQSLVVLSVILLDRLGELVIVGQRLNRLITALKCYHWFDLSCEHGKKKRDRKRLLCRLKHEEVEEKVWETFSHTFPVTPVQPKEINITNNSSCQ